MKPYRSISLQGDWYMGVIPEDTPPREEPQGESWMIRDAVPAYWEDLVDAFTAVPLHRSLSWNPLYTRQKYPQAGYVPDMALPNVTGRLFYTRNLIVTAPIEAEEIRLWCGGVQNSLTLFVNGSRIGTHEGYSASFEISVPSEAFRVGENRITLAVSNRRLAGYAGRPVSGCTSRAACECTGGVYGDLELRLYHGGLRDAWITIAEDTASLTVHAETDGREAGHVRILSGTETVRSGEIPAGGTEFSCDTDGLARWTPDSPVLYTAEITVGDACVTRRFGIRRLCTAGTDLRLNGEPFYFRGICEHGYFPMTAHPTRDKTYYRHAIRTLKRLGFNAIRFHTQIPMEEYMEAADELGILLEVETPNNTTVAEWAEIVRMCRRHTSVTAYSSGNEMVIDEPYIEHLRACAALVHEGTDSLFSPMSAMRGIEYFSWGSGRTETPFTHDPVRLAALGEFSDLYNSYSLGTLSYESDDGSAAELDRRNAVYGKPILSHEICIHGTYCDLSLAPRYRGTRIGETALYSSVEEHLAAKGLLDRAPLYYGNSCRWQQILRKACFENARRAKTVAGYDFLGDMDHHWHTFGYCVGMMNEFRELKPGETEENVLRYNADTVLLADLPENVSLRGGETVEIPLSVSHFGTEIDRAVLRICLNAGKEVVYRREIRLGAIPRGEITDLYRMRCTLPRVKDPTALRLTVSLHGGNTDAENVWDLYAFPRPTAIPKKTLRDARVRVTESITEEELLAAMQNGERVVLLGPGPFAHAASSFRISLAGRTEGLLATVIADHPLMEKFPHEGFCGTQCRAMMRGGHVIRLEGDGVPFAPIVEAADTYKNAHRSAMLFEYRMGAGRMLVCGFRLAADDPAAAWLRAEMLAYAASDRFAPQDELTEAMLRSLCGGDVTAEGNTNTARNLNDITV